jgi:hypothetical protein
MPGHINEVCTDSQERHGAMFLLVAELISMLRRRVKNRPKSMLIQNMSLACWSHSTTIMAKGLNQIKTETTFQTGTTGSMYNIVCRGTGELEGKILALVE